PELGDRRPRRGLLLGERTGASDTATTPAHAARRATGTSGAATTPAPAARRPDRRLRLALAGTPGEGPTRRDEARSAPPTAIRACLAHRPVPDTFSGMTPMNVRFRTLGSATALLAALFSAAPPAHAQTAESEYQGAAALG